MTVNAITDTRKGRTGIAPTYLHTTPHAFAPTFALEYFCLFAYFRTFAVSHFIPALRRQRLKTDEERVLRGAKGHKGGMHLGDSRLCYECFITNNISHIFTAPETK